jgi:hypothetical protein
MKISFDCYASARPVSDLDKLLDAAQCRAAGLDGLEETKVEIAPYLDDPLITDEGLVDAGVRYSIDKHGHLHATLSFRCLSKLSSKQLRALTRELEAQLQDGWGGGHTIKTPSGEVAIEWFDRVGMFGAKFKVKQADDGEAVPDRRTPLSIKAAEAGDVRALLVALDAGVDVNARGKWRMTALMLAARDGHEACVDLLLQRGASVNLVSETNTALGLASMSGYVAIVRKLLAAGADSSLGNKPALHWAANRGHEEVARLLVETGADKSAVDDQEETALFCAKKPEIISLLVQAGWDTKVKNRHSETPLEHALGQADSFERGPHAWPEGAQEWRAAAEELGRWSE